MGWYKYQVTKKIRQGMGMEGQRFFQRSYYDHVVRNEKDYAQIGTYIQHNPARWVQDKLYTE